mmetsp:Transcript_20418/g.42630  ORF Transcript_20418/g.42630 Transcript_20418/m.42630 type:complete len:227 (-) Transcript_20418:187-867(-)
MNATARLFESVARRATRTANNARITTNPTTTTTTTRSLVYPRHNNVALFREATRGFVVSGSGSSHAIVARRCPLQQATTTPSFNSNNGSNNGNSSNNEPSNENEQRRFRSNRSRRGLYDGKDIRTGNNLSFSMKHTKRTFKPNVFIKRVYSEILDEMVRFHLTTSTLRSIDKCGGLDNYLLTSRHITSGEGLKTKKRIVNALKYRERKAGGQQQQQQQHTTATEEA